MPPETEIYIQGQRYVVRSDQPREHLLVVAGMVDARLREMSAGRQSSYPHAVLACLNVASELFDLRRELDQLRREIANQVQELAAEADRGLRALTGESD